VIPTTTLDLFAGIPVADYAAALQWYERLLGSPQLSDYYWLPKTLTAADALLIDYRPAEVTWLCTAPQLIAHLTVPYGVKGLEQGATVTVCRLKLPVSRAWGRLRNFS
jgi:hypothetical protein